MRLAFVAALVGALACSSVAVRADDPPSPDDFAFAMGQMAGSQTACDIPKDQVNALVSKAFDKMKLDVKEGTPLFDRFVKGFADGTKTVKDGGATCADVKTGFDTFSAQLGQ